MATTGASVGAQEIRRILDDLTVPEVDFQPPEVDEYRLSNGVSVFFLPDFTLPLVEVQARFSGGWGRFPRTYFGAGSALPTLLRRGGTTTRSPDSVSHALEYLAVQTSFGASGESVTSTMNTLTEHLDEALELWAGMLRDPGFDSSELSLWRAREVETVRRRTDDPGRLAFAEFNRLLYGDHPVGWEVTEEDLDEGRLTPESLRWLQRRILCPDNLLLGVVGDVTWEEIRPLLEREMAEWPSCAEALPPPPEARVGAPPGVYLIPKEINQSVVVLAHPAKLRQGDHPDYFAAQIGNSILGAGGFSSRLLGRVRTEEGLAYGASSIWTTPRRYDGLLGATTRTRTDATVQVIQVVRETMASMTEDPATPDEVGGAVAEWVNGWVFNFDSPARIVSRMIAYRASGLPDDWLQRYLAGIQAVDAEAVEGVYRRHLRPEDLVILVVGDGEALRTPLEALGPVRVLPVDGGGGAAQERSASSREPGRTAPATKRAPRRRN
jgi:zinc protease